MTFFKRTFNGRKDKGVFCIDKIFDDKYFKAYPDLPILF